MRPMMLLLVWLAGPLVGCGYSELGQARGGLPREPARTGLDEVKPPAPPDTTVHVSDEKDGVLIVHGSVRWESFEGGFWMIDKYDVRNLPPEFQHNGLRVTVGLRPVRDAFSFHMAGTLADVVWIRRER